MMNSLILNSLKFQQLGWPCWTPVPHTAVSSKHFKTYDTYNKLMSKHTDLGKSTYIAVIEVALGSLGES